MGPYKFQNPWGSMRDTYGDVSWDKHGFGIGNQYWAPKSKEQLRNEFLSAVAIALVAVGGPALAGGLGGAGGAATGAQAAGAAGQAALGTASAGGSGLATATALAGFLNSVAQNPPSVGQAIEPGNFGGNPLQTPSVPRSPDSAPNNPITHIQPQHPGQRFLDLLVEELDRNPQLLQLGKSLLRKRQTGQTDQDAVLSNPTLNRIANDAMNRVVGQVVREGEAVGSGSDFNSDKSNYIDRGIYEEIGISSYMHTQLNSNGDPIVPEGAIETVVLDHLIFDDRQEEGSNWVYRKEVRFSTENDIATYGNERLVFEQPIVAMTVIHKKYDLNSLNNQGGTFDNSTQIIAVENHAITRDEYVNICLEENYQNGLWDLGNGTGELYDYFLKHGSSRTLDASKKLPDALSKAVKVNLALQTTLINPQSSFMSFSNQFNASMRVKAIKLALIGSGSVASIDALVKLYAEKTMPPGYYRPLSIRKMRNGKLVDYFPDPGGPRIGYWSDFKKFVWPK